MNQKPKSHQINIAQSEFGRLIKEFPDQAKILEGLTDFLGSKAIININDLTPGTKAELGVDLINRLYRLAYNLDKKKFLSYFQQLNEILNLPKSKVQSILEIGPGAGIFESLIKNFDYNLTTLDVVLCRNPHILGNIIDLPVRDKAFDLVCAFEVLQHIPYRYFQQAMKEMARCARHYLYISLPCPINSLYVSIDFKILQRFFKRLSFEFKLLQLLPTALLDKDEDKLLKRPDKHNPHYWEVNRRSFPKKRILNDMDNCGLRVLREFHSYAHPYHYFILCEV